MSTRTRVLVVLGFRGVLYLAFNLRTRWRPTLLDTEQIYPPSILGAEDEHGYGPGELFGFRRPGVDGGLVLIISIAFKPSG